MLIALLRNTLIMTSCVELLVPHPSYQRMSTIDSLSTLSSYTFFDYCTLFIILQEEKEIILYEESRDCLSCQKNESKKGSGSKTEARTGVILSKEVMLQKTVRVLELPVFLDLFCVRRAINSCLSFERKAVFFSLNLTCSEKRSHKHKVSHNENQGYSKHVHFANSSEKKSAKRMKENITD